MTAVTNQKSHGVGTRVIMIFLRHLNFEEIEVWAKCKNKIKHEISKIVNSNERETRTSIYNALVLGRTPDSLNKNWHK